VALDREIRPLKLPGQAYSDAVGCDWGHSPQQCDPGTRAYAATPACALRLTRTAQLSSAICARNTANRQQQSVHMHPQGLDRRRPVRSGHGLDSPTAAKLCVARITLNGATQPKPDLWSLTSTSLLWLGWSTSTPVLTLPKPLRESVTPSCAAWLPLACGPAPLAAGDNLPSTWPKTPQSTIAALAHHLCPRRHGRTKTSAKFPLS
jgi:hypothetical protein